MNFNTKLYLVEMFDSVLSLNLLKDDIQNIDDELTKYINEKIEERNKAKFILSNVINYFYNHSDELPQLYKNIINEEGSKR